MSKRWARLVSEMLVLIRESTAFACLSVLDLFSYVKSLCTIHYLHPRRLSRVEDVNVQSGSIKRTLHMEFYA